MDLYLARVGIIYLSLIPESDNIFYFCHLYSLALATWSVLKLNIDVIYSENTDWQLWLWIFKIFDFAGVLLTHKVFW